MAFQINRSEISKHTFISLKDDENFTATIIPARGAMLHELKIVEPGLEFNFIDSISTQELLAESNEWFKGVKLSPWPCRIPDGAYTFSEHSFHLSKLFTDGSALHGLLYDQPFKIVEEFADDQTASVRLRHHYLPEDEGYPFEYNCEVRFALHPDHILEIETTVTNLSQDEIPIADGWHPYFHLGGKVDEWELQFQASSKIEFDDRLVPTGRLLPYNDFNQFKQIGNIELDNCFLLDEQPNVAACMIRNPANGLGIHFFPDRSYPYLQIFIPPDRTSIAIENLSGAPDCFNNKMGLVVLMPGMSRTFRVYYQIEF